MKFVELKYALNPSANLKDRAFLCEYVSEKIHHPFTSFTRDTEFNYFLFNRETALE